MDQIWVSMTVRDKSARRPRGINEVKLVLILPLPVTGTMRKINRPEISYLPLLQA